MVLCLLSIPGENKYAPLDAWYNLEKVEIEAYETMRQPSVKEVKIISCKIYCKNNLCML